MSEDKIESPKVFISYSWSSSDHEDWVLQLATDLEESGLHIILDKWNLREGADKYAFMEKMVTDKSVKKVVVICDRLYAEKADDRKGGVGTETQIISHKLYDQVDPSDQKQKFVAIIAEKDDKGTPYVPTFLKSRVYIDMSTNSLRTENYEQLLRWFYDQPLHKRPVRGKPPSYIFEDTQVSLGTTSRYHQAIDALRQNKITAYALCQEFFDTFVNNFETLRLTPEEGKEFDDQVVDSIEAFLPYRDEMTEVLMSIAKYRSDGEMINLVHRFLERLIPYGYWPSGTQSWSEWNADNYMFILNEIFIYSIAAFLKHGRFDAVNEILGQDYYFHGSPDAPDDGMAPYTFFNGFCRSLSHRNQRLKLNRLSIMADLFNSRAKRIDLNFNDIMQADFILFLRADLHLVGKSQLPDRWQPHTLVYASFGRPPIFEIFARSQSARYFNQMKISLGVDSKAELQNLIEQYRNEKLSVPKCYVPPIRDRF